MLLLLILWGLDGMTKLITSLEELEAEIAAANCDKQHFYHLHMFPSRVEQWHKDGHWKYIRAQLRTLPHLKYACVHTFSRSGLPFMDFYFFVPAEELCNRISNFIEPIWEGGTQIPLVNCKTTKRVDIAGETGNNIHDKASIAPCCLIM